MSRDKESSRQRFGSLSSTQDPQRLSMTVTGILIALLPLVREFIGVEISQESVTTVVDAILTLVGAITGVVGYVRSKR